jgi:hypothetical protein
MKHAGKHSESNILRTANFPAPVLAPKIAAARIESSSIRAKRRKK